MSAIINFIDKFSVQVTIVLFALCIFLIVLFTWLWLTNRKTYQMLKHQIPADVVKNYLDSIIQNSTSLKSSLFRGGGLDVDTSSVPSVLPIADLPTGGQVGVNDADVASLQARISSLESSLDAKNQIIKNLEEKNSELSGELKHKDEQLQAKDEKILELENKVAELLAKLEAQPSSQEDNSQEHLKTIADLEAQVASLKEQLQEYEVISDDIANMKKLKEENAQLKQSLAAGSAAVTLEESLELPDEAPSIAEEAKVEEEINTEEANIAEEADEEPSLESEQEGEQENQLSPEEEEVADVKVEEASAEDLLSEFEKMLG